MFRNLTTGQWIMFWVLTLFTFFGGFMYVAAEAHFNRADRATGQLPTAAVVPAPERKKTDPFWVLVFIAFIVSFHVVARVLG